MSLRICLLSILAIVAAWALPTRAAAQPWAPGQPAVPPLPQPPATPIQPFILAPQDEANLDVLLRAWQHHSGLVQTFSCDFTLFKYDATWSQRSDSLMSQSEGEIKFAKPDKGLYRITKIDGKPAEEGDHWVCDGKAIYTKEFKTKTVKEYRLPPELQGKAISDGPLPFVFGVEADKLKQRYWMRITTPPGTQGQVWLEAYPKHARDAQNFRRVEIVLNDKDLTPLAIQVYQPNDDSPKIKVTDAYVFANIKKNATIERLREFLTVFISPTAPPTWKHVIEEPPPSGNAADAQPPDRKLPPGGQVERPLSLPPRR